MKKVVSGDRKRAEQRKRSGQKSARNYLPAVERRNSIVKAAQTVFSRTPLQGARVRDLAEAAGINPATLYCHFESKEQLFAEAVAQPLVEAMQGMYERVAGYESAHSAEEFMAQARVSALHHLESMVDIYPLLVTALFSDQETGAQLYSKHIEPLFTERGKAMSKVVRKGIDPKLFSLLAFGMFLAVAMDGQFTGKGNDLAEIAEQIMQLSTFGIAGERYRS